MQTQRLYEKPLPVPSPSQNESSDSWQYHYQKILSTLQGTPQQKQSTIRKRILRYFGQFNLQSQNYFSLRNDIDYSTPGLQLITNQLLLYGVDYMTVERARAYFQGWITRIRRMDDSHFVVEFRSQGECLAAVNGVGRDGRVYGGVREVVERSRGGWVQLRPYYEFIFQRRLMARYCTNLDQFSPSSTCNSTKQSYTLAYSQAKRRFMKSLKEDLQKYQFRKQNRGYNARCGSRSRSRDKFDGREGREGRDSRDMHICGKERSNIGRAYVSCGCRCGERRQRRRDVSSSRQRSDSLSSGQCLQDDYSNRRRRSKLLQQQKIKQADFKFQLYIKRRDQALNPSVAQTSPIPQLPSFASIPLFQSKHRTKPNNKQKSISTTQQSCFEISPTSIPLKTINPSFQQQAQPTSTTSLSTPTTTTPKIHTQTNYSRNKQNQMMLEQEQTEQQQKEEQMDFQMFLQKLKLEDSRGEYSAFDLDLIDGME